MTNPSNGDNIALHLDDVWVQYQLRHAHHYNLKRTLTNTITRKSDNTEVITALHGITLEIPRGSRLGLAGPNGSGKSTLLAVMAGTLAPSQGCVKTNGRVLALLGGPNESLDPEQTGRQNAVALGIRLGEKKATIEALLEEIKEFSGLGPRFDHPVYSYSNGMSTRLRISTITSLRADILLIDEGLGTADVEFASAAQQRIERFFNDSGTLVLASHSEELLSNFCDQTLQMSSKWAGTQEQIR